MSAVAEIAARRVRVITENLIERARADAARGVRVVPVDGGFALEGRGLAVRHLIDVRLRNIGR